MLREKILAALDASSGLSAEEIADEVGSFEPDVERCLSGELKYAVINGKDGLWYRKPATLGQRVQEVSSRGTASEPEDEHESIITDSLGRLRRKLLDLTGRNGLLNYRHPAKRCVRIIDELPDQLVQLLLSSSKGMRFLPVPNPTRQELIDAGYIEIEPDTGDEIVSKQPTAREWAKHLGFDVSYEVPPSDSVSDDESKHQDDAIQTLLFEDEMETRLRSIRQLANSALEETGANILYLALGFLEWTESNTSKSSDRVAPLYLLPVQLVRGKLNEETRTYEYRLQYSDGDVITNISLREKLKNDFALALPEIEEETTPEQYLEQISEFIRDRKPDWRVRRFVTLAQLNFSKQLLYLDLDPNRWPAGRSITEHKLVKACLTGLANADSRDDSIQPSFAEEHDIDAITNVYGKYPLVANADSSQHSALIDAVNGKNLVIEGPPGTGKSQTITNLIGASIAVGKTVLFVAEKVAALQVVKSNLDKAGLGMFCLELHSHKSQKRRVLDDIDERIRLGKRLKKPKDIDKEIAFFEDRRKRLKAHADQVNSNWKKTDLTIHEIFAKAARYENELSISPVELSPETISGETYTPVVAQDVLSIAKRICELRDEIIEKVPDTSSIEQHPWFGIRNDQLQAHDQADLLQRLERWNAAVLAVRDDIERFSAAMGSQEKFNDSKSYLAKLIELVQAIPDVLDSDILFPLPNLTGERLTGFSKGLVLYREIQSLYDQLDETMTPSVLSSIEASTDERASLQWVVSAASDESTVDNISEALQRLERIYEVLPSIGDSITATNESLGLAAKHAFDTSLDGIAGLTRLVNLVVALPAGLLKRRSPMFDDDGLDDILPKLREELERLKRDGADLQRLFSLEDILAPSVLAQHRETLESGGVMRWLSSDWRSARKAVIAMRAGAKARFGDLLANLSSLERYEDARLRFESNAAYKQGLAEHFRGFDTDLDELESLRHWYKSVRNEYGKGFDSRVAVGDAVLDIGETLAKQLHSLHRKGLADEAEKISESARFCADHFPTQTGLLDPKVKIDGADSPLRRLFMMLRERVPQLQASIANEQATVRELKGVVLAIDKLSEKLPVWRSAKFSSAFLGDRHRLETGRHKTDASLLTALDKLEAIAKILASDAMAAPIRSKINREPSVAAIKLVKVRAAALAKKLSTEQETFSDFAGATALKGPEWFAQCGDGVGRIATRNQRALENPQALAGWLTLIRSETELVEAGWSSLAHAIERGTVGRDQVDAAVNLGAMHQLAKEILAEEPELARFSGLSQQALQKEFREYDSRLRASQRELVAFKAAARNVPAGVQGPLVRDKTEFSLIDHELQKKTRHIPLRRLVQRSASALQALKPCFMMGPMSVAQYLEPGVVEFDLIVMDEASQIRPEDALGAVARGGQLVIVGDPKQLPPTSFFDKQLDDEIDEEEMAAAEQSESILEAAISTFRARRLRWHYRSQHESLIEFSNHAFYGSDLVVFPSATHKSDDLGVHFTHVARGRFSNRVNREEARIIAESVRHHMLTKPDESLGVVAMSATQREQIERAIEDATKEDSQFRLAMEDSEARDEPFFVKNLENVQGDERDVIYISVTYGPAEIGQPVMQRFGPINSTHGWRRLNVLFTRSKRRMHIFSSMRHSDVIVHETSSRGVHALKDFLNFAENGKLPTTVEHSGRDPDSDFEVAVMRALENEGFECQPQVGAAGYFIDLAVRDPGNRGRFLMAIECDGATYHSAKSTRDRDILRQRVLESQGWLVRRIWSTDWFNDPRGELAPIIGELHRLKSEPSAPEDALPSEVDQIEELNEELNDEGESLESTLSGQIPGDLSLRGRLEHFDEQVIRKHEPETPAEQRLLRPAMLDALVRYKPRETWEFKQDVPPYLRQGTAAAEGKYLKQVLQIIYDYEDGEG